METSCRPWGLGCWSFREQFLRAQQCLCQEAFVRDFHCLRQSRSSAWIQEPTQIVRGKSSDRWRYLPCRDLLEQRVCRLAVSHEHCLQQEIRVSASAFFLLEKECPYSVSIVSDCRGVWWAVLTIGDDLFIGLNDYSTLTEVAAKILLTSSACESLVKSHFARTNDKECFSSSRRKGRDPFIVFLQPSTPSDRFEAFILGNTRAVQILNYPQC